MSLTEPELIHVAQVAYNAITELQVLRGRFKLEDAPQWCYLDDDERASVIESVKYTIENRIEGAHLRHKRWLKGQLRDGWKFGYEFDPEKKTSPNVRPWEALDAIERHSARLFIAVVNSLA